jgi:hypothetical protein
MPFDGFKKNFGKNYTSSSDEATKKTNYDKNMARLKLADC